MIYLVLGLDFFPRNDSRFSIIAPAWRDRETLPCRGNAWRGIYSPTSTAGFITGLVSKQKWRRVTHPSAPLTRRRLRPEYVTASSAAFQYSPCFSPPIFPGRNQRRSQIPNAVQRHVFRQWHTSMA